jgi:predicted nucleotide-binding protein (sugar kinase/HSP70/actin superfamily)
MKKLLFIPTTDTVTLCLPREWVGKSIICTLREEQTGTLVVAVAESNGDYPKGELRRRLRRGK